MGHARTILFICLIASGSALAETIYVPPVVISGLYHQYSYDPNFNVTGWADGVAFGGDPVGEFSGPGFDAAIGQGDEIVVRFEAPAGMKFTATIPEGVTTGGFYVEAQWRSDLLNSSLPPETMTVTWENLVGTEPVSGSRFASAGNHGYSVHVEEGADVPGSIQFTAVEMRFTVGAAADDLLLSYGEVDSEHWLSFRVSYYEFGQLEDRTLMRIVSIVNSPPVADAGEDQYVSVDDTVQLAGEGDDPDGDPIVSWQWNFVQLPFGSLAELDDPAAQAPSFTADMAGNYVVSLVVSDGMDPSEPDYVTVSASGPCAEPVPILAVDPTEGPAPLKVTFDSSDSYDPYGYPMYAEWNFGDGSPIETEPYVIHTYEESGDYEASFYLYNECGMDVLVPISLQVGVTDVPGSAPLRFALHSNVPNPFNPMTTIRFDLPHASRVSLRVYDMAGRLVQTLANDETMEAGRREVTWRGRDENDCQVAAGIYFYRLIVGEHQATRRMTLVK